MTTGPQPIDFRTGAGQARPLDVRWIHGSPSAKHDTDPEIQVHAYDEHTAILRQNKAINYEAPFLYLLFGNTRAVLIDTGATAEPEFFPLRHVVDGLIAAWLARHPREGYALLVLHTHAHGDHVAGDGQFADRPETTVIDARRASAWEFFGFGTETGGNADADAGTDPETEPETETETETETDPETETVGRVDLGGRVLECLPTPGHHEASVTFYDRWTGFLLTGDTVYRGRLYVQDWRAFSGSIDRLIAFSERRPVTHVLGCHIEMTRQPGVDYPIRTTYQPDEPPLEMTVGHLHRIRAAIDEMDAAAADRGGSGTRRPRAYDDFVIWPEEG